MSSNSTSTSGPEVSISTVFLFLWLHSGRWLWVVGYVVTAVAGLYTHYFFPAILLVQNVYLLIWLLRNRGQRPLRKTLLAWIGMMVAVFVLYLPELAFLLPSANFVPHGADWPDGAEGR